MHRISDFSAEELTRLLDYCSCRFSKEKKKKKKDSVIITQQSSAIFSCVDKILGYAPDGKKRFKPESCHVSNNKRL